MLRGHPVLPTSPQGANATEGGADVLLAISREFGKSLAVFGKSLASLWQVFGVVTHGRRVVQSIAGAFQLVGG